jgi:hypothetical protein
MPPSLPFSGIRPRKSPALPGESAADASTRHLARVLDAAVRIPGTRLRIGLDPLLGLIPGIGDTVAAGLGSLILLHAMKCGAPRTLLLRMTGNVMINAAVGAIPLIGDLFSAWFHSNTRNYALLKAWQSGDTRVSADRQTKWVVAGCLVSAALLAGVGVLAAWALSALWHWVSGGAR